MAPPSLRHRSLHAVLAIGACLAVVWFFQWTVRTSGGFNPPGDEDYYNFLVRGWWAGQLHLSKEPSPEMKALPDPYDPAQNGPHRMADASYYQGHYYLYFGPTPAAVLLFPHAAVTGRELGSTSAICIFAITGFLASTGLFLSVRRRYFPSAPRWYTPLAILMLGGGTHVLALQRRPLVWELPIATAYAFSALGLTAVWWALHRRHRALPLGLAGLCFGLAGGARPTFLVAALALVFALAGIFRAERDGRALGRQILSVGAGLGFCVALLLWHNFLRFENAFEFGQNHQLTGVYESRMQHFRAAYLPHNAFIYFLHPPQLQAAFPFVTATAVRGGPEGYLGEWNEAVCGLLVSFPFLWLLVGLPLGWRAAWPLRTMLLTIGGMHLALLLLMLAFFLATPRYLADFAPSLMLLATLGGLAVHAWAIAKPVAVRVALTVATVTAGLVSAVAGVLLSFGYHGQLLKTLSPEVWQRLSDWFS